jgi:hypothetical protein
MSNAPPTFVPDWQSARLAVLLGRAARRAAFRQRVGQLALVERLRESTMENVAAVITRARQTRGVQYFRVLQHAVCHVNAGK